MRTLLGLFSLLLSPSCMGALGLWVYQVIALSAMVAMQGGLATSWSISPLGWLLLTLMAGGAIGFLGLGLALMKSREPDDRRD
jgi:hypothetical protein